MNVLTPVRLQMIEQLVANYKAATFTINAARGGEKFDVVEVGALSDTDAQKRYAVGIVAGEERKTDTFPFKVPQFEVVIEFRGTVNKGDEVAGIFAERLLGVVQQVVYSDQTLGGICYEMTEVGNEVDLMTYNDRTARGVVRFRFTYRHSTQSVYTTSGAV